MTVLCFLRKHLRHDQMQWRHNGRNDVPKTNLTIVYSTVYSGTDQRKHQSSATLAFVRGIHRWPVNSPHKWPVTWKMFPFDDVVMKESSISVTPFALEMDPDNIKIPSIISFHVELFIPRTVFLDAVYTAVILWKTKQRQSKNHYGCIRVEERTLIIDCRQGKSEGFDSWDRPCNLAQIRSKSIFQPVWP